MIFYYEFQKKNRFLYIISFLLMSLLFSLKAHAQAGTYMIVCEGYNTRTGIRFDGQVVNVPPSADTQTFKIGPNSINSRRCQVSRNALLMCTRPKFKLAAPPGANKVQKHAEGSERLDRYSGKMISTTTMYFRSGDYASINDEFIGYCKKAKKRF